MNKTFMLIGLLVLVLIAGGAWYYFSLPGTEESSESTVKPATNEKTSGQSDSVPSGFRTVSDATVGVSFNISEAWTSSKVPESGHPAYVSPGYSSKAMKITGAHIGYSVYLPPEGWENKPEEYMELLKGNARGWEETTLDGRPAYITSIPHATETRYWIISRSGDRFIDISYADETGQYESVFDEFVKSFHVE